MYLKNALVNFLKIKNVILLVIGICFAAGAVAAMTRLIVSDHGDWSVIFYDSGTPIAVFCFYLGGLMIACSRISRKLINDACFYSGYFEGDLNGYVDFAELSEVTGKTPEQIQTRLKLLRPLYMKNFKVIPTPNVLYPEIIELYSKTVTCTCRSCGGRMEKRVYFTGVCPYCGSSDLTAQVVSGQRFYFINDNVTRKPSVPSYYEAPSLHGKRIGYAVSIGIGLFFWLILLIVMMTSISNFNNESYFKDFRDISSSFTSIQSVLITVIIVCAFALTAITVTVPITIARISSVESAERYARAFARFPKPFLSIPELFRLTGRSSSTNSTGAGIAPEAVYRDVVKAIKDGYLRGCSPEKHGGTLRIALAKQIVKDRCPGCGAPIVDAVHENYHCRYCGRLIMGVIRKQ